MKTKYDLSKAPAVVDEYVAAIQDKSQAPGKHGRTWLEFVMQRNGLIPDVRQLGFMESHALWYACLVTTKRVREVSRLEIENKHARKGRTTERTIRRTLGTKWTPERDSLCSILLHQILGQEY